ncbi:MAG TPA: hypothetical protein VK204_16655 [Nocardioidaceae bacterium]|nr:hypothetical protein [Nocardioidaceae bacterium]
MLGERVGVLVAAGGAAWEIEALRVVSSPPARSVLLKRCVDLPDLLASATTGQARVAVVASGLPGLDADSLAHLRRAGVGVVLVTDSGTPPERAALPGVFEVVPAAEVTSLTVVVPAAAAEAAADDAGPPPAGLPPAPLGADSGESEEVDAVGAEPACRGRVLAVWGPTGAPGRTTLATGLAAELAHRGQDTLLIDADAYGGAVAQHLGVLDEVSGLLSAVRLANAGRLDVAQLAAVARAVGPRLRVLTGLPRAERWVEVRDPAFDAVLDAGRRLSEYVVLDLGFNLEQEVQTYGTSAPQRNHMTLAGLEQADEVLVVGSADPVGLSRLARGLVELPEVASGSPTRVVVNRVRPSLGWSEQEMRGMVEGFLTPASTHFLPDDPGATDRALMAGRPLVEMGESSLGAAISRLVDHLDGSGTEESSRRAGLRLRRRRAGRAR